MIDRLQCAFSTGDIKSDFSRVNFERKTNPSFLEFVEDRIPLGCKVRVAIVDLRSAYRREAVKQRPNLGTGEAIDHAHSEKFCGVGGLDDFLSSALLHTVWFPVAPYVWGQNGFMALI